jgi:hypothetical protein
VTWLEAEMIDDGLGKNFGCEHCWPPNATAAWEARGMLTREAELIDESHFHVMILACHDCTQRFVSVFTETVDWADGEDSQYWKLLPVTEAEAADLIQQRESLTEARLEALGPGRRCLWRDFPKGSEPQVFWKSGMFVDQHD